MPKLDLSEWDQYLSSTPDAHLLQTGLWGEFKGEFGWEVMRVVAHDNSAGAQILFRRLPLGFRMAYIPKGPVLPAGGIVHSSSWDSLWQEIDGICRSMKVVFLKVEPDLLEPSRSNNRDEISTKPVAKYYIPSEDLFDADIANTLPEGFEPGLQDIQPRRTMIVNLRGDDDRILGRMKQKTRYNIRLALKKGVIVRSCTDLDLFYRLMSVTGVRDSFDVHSKEYYQSAYDTFYPRGICEYLLAEYQGDPLAGLMVFAQGRRSWYFYGASSNVHRERMPTYLLQWEAMRWARSMGCIEYDLWGVPDEDYETLEQEFPNRSDELWGVYRFKRGFGGRLYRTIGSWDRVYIPSLYTIYRIWSNR